MYIILRIGSETSEKPNLLLCVGSLPLFQSVFTPISQVTLSWESGDENRKVGTSRKGENSRVNSAGSQNEKVHDSELQDQKGTKYLDSGMIKEINTSEAVYCLKD